MLRRVACNIVQSRGIKHTVNIKWVRPEYVPAYKPEKSGDLEGMPPIPESALGIDYALTEEIKEHLFSCLFIFSVAWLTAQIRYLQDTMDKFPRNSKMKQLVQERIDRRKKLLKFLRQYDYKKFEWLLEKLNIEYKAHPESHHKLSRKESLRKLTEMHCEDIRKKKLDDYRNLLESQQGPYLKQKLEALTFIRSEQIDLQMPVTVTEQDIKKVEQMLAEWTIKDQMKQQAQKRKKIIAIDLN
ncbi:unnamed protein product [Arctia plantaginis]|uniref:Small ribosomal subunit protein uS15m n=1 Tax=Arctia plantaginis TaxID=874455 RepID=A0A8S0YS01_ARCPL|nr:unnamed protein product [Arctia plantaginis]